MTGVSNARAYTELIHLARESVRVFGLAPRIEIGNPAFVRALFELAEVPPGRRDALAAAIDHRDMSPHKQLDAGLKLPADLRDALLGGPLLFRGSTGRSPAPQHAPWR